MNKLFVFKSLLTMPSNVLPLRFKQTLPPIIWIFTEGEGDEIKSRLPFKIFSTLMMISESEAKHCRIKTLYLGMMVVGIFGKKDELEGFLQYDGLLHGGEFYLLGVQILACICFMIWAGTITFTLIYVSSLVLFCYCRMVASIYFMKLFIEN